MSRFEQLFSVSDKVALVTGAGTGIGRQIASTLASAGAKVVCAARNLERLEQVSAEIRAAGGDAIAIAVDVGSTASVEHLFDQADQAYGPVNVLVNCAAQDDYGLFPDIRDENWENLVNINLSGTMRTCRSFARRLMEAKQGGSIINISSIVGAAVMPGVPTYCTLKGATNQLTRSMAVDMFGHNIRVNALAPGYFHTEMTAPLWTSEAGQAAVARHPLKRVGHVEELDGPVLFLASDASSHVNGIVLNVDAGHSVQLH